MTDGSSRRRDHDREGRPAPNVIMLDALVGNDYAYCLCRGLSQIGAPVSLITVAGRDEPFPVDFEVFPWAPSKSGSKGTRSKVLPYVGYLWRTLRLVRRSARRGPTVVHVQFLRRPRIEALYLSLLRRTGARLVVTAHNVVPHEARWLDRVVAALTLRTAHRIIVHSDHIANVLATSRPRCVGKIAVVPHGHFDHYRSATDPSRAEARSRFGLMPHDMVLLFFGFIREYKGLDRLITAFSRVAPDKPELKLLIAGRPATSELARRYKDQIGASGVSDRILFHDRFVPRDEVATYFAAADLTVLPYSSIYHSGVVHLASTFASPVLAHDVGDLAEMIEHEQTGYIVESSLPALVEGIVRALEDRSELEQMGTRARAANTHKGSWSAIARSTLDAYEI